MNLTDLTEIREASQSERMDIFIQKLYGRPADELPSLAIDVQLALRKLQHFWLVPEIAQTIRIESEEEMNAARQGGVQHKIIVSETSDGRVVKISDKPTNAFNFLCDYLGIGWKEAKPLDEIRIVYSSLNGLGSEQIDDEWYAELALRVCKVLHNIA